MTDFIVETFRHGKFESVHVFETGTQAYHYIWDYEEESEVEYLPVDVTVH
jgi:hypothetical protein